MVFFRKYWQLILLIVVIGLVGIIGWRLLSDTQLSVINNRVFKRTTVPTPIPLADRITHLQLEAPVKQQESQFDKFDVERQELDPVQDPDQLDAKQEASLYTALKTLRGEVIRFVPAERSLVIKPVKNNVLGTRPVTVDLSQLDEIVCWPEYYKANDGSKVALSNAYITIQPTREEFYWTNQKVWPYSKAAGQIISVRHVLVKLDQDFVGGVG